MALDKDLIEGEVDEPRTVNCKVWISNPKPVFCIVIVLVLYTCGYCYNAGYQRMSANNVGPLGYLDRLHHPGTLRLLLRDQVRDAVKIKKNSVEFPTLGL